MDFPLNFVPLSDARIFDIPTKDNEEELIDLHECDDKILLEQSSSFSPRTHLMMFWLRSGACSRLILAAQKLPQGYCFLIKETIRPASVQKSFFSRSLIEARKRYPSASEVQIIEAASRYTAPPQVAGHPTGGAIDITLASANGVELDLGSPYDENEVRSEGRCFSNAENITQQAKQHRAILFKALLEAGFVNYPFEWWHWSYGDKYWAFQTGNLFAIYGEAFEK